MRLAGERVGGASSPARPSAALVLAARELAALSARGEPSPIAPGRLRGALARAFASDPAPAAYLVAAAPGEVLASLAGILPRGGATHVGAGAVERDGTLHLVLVTVERRVRLAPFPRDVAPGERAVLSGTLAPGLREPRVFSASPAGEVRRIEVSGTRPFHAPVAFSAPGRWVVEVVASGPHGPEVVALLAVSAGGAPLDPPERRAVPEPDDPAEAEARVVAEIDALRRRHRLPPLTPAPELQALARRHSADMLARGQLAHVLPGAGDVGERLRRARLPYRTALENIAKGQTAAAAHAAAEDSPAHRANLLSRAIERVGVGVARGRLVSGAPVVYLTEVLVGPPDDGASSPLTPEGRVREALWRERARRGAPPLASDPRLDDLARQVAAELRSRGVPEPGDLVSRALALGRGLGAADAFVASEPGEAARSANLPDPRFRRVGVGVSIGDSERFGAARLWIAVVYTD